MTRLPSYIRDTTDFINKLRKLLSLLPNSLLVTLNVTSLYINIPQKEGITACDEDLNQRESMIPSPADLHVCQLIQFIFIMNSFHINDEYYVQTHGTAMCMRMAPSYANLFMGKLEHEFLATQIRLPREWWRYIK